MSSIAFNSYMQFSAASATRHAPNCEYTDLGTPAEVGCSCSPRARALHQALSADLLAAVTAITPEWQSAPAYSGPKEWLENMPVPNAQKLKSTPTFPEPDWALHPLFYPHIPSTRSASREAPQAPASANPDESFEYIPTPNAPRLAATPTISGLKPGLPAFDPLPPHHTTPYLPQPQLVAPPTTRLAYTHHIEKSICPPYPSPDAGKATISSSIGPVRSARQTKARTNPRPFAQAGFMIVSAEEAARPAGQRRAARKAVATARKAASKPVQRATKKRVQDATNPVPAPSTNPVPAPSTVASSASVPRRTSPEQTDPSPLAVNPASSASTQSTVNLGLNMSATTRQHFAELFSFLFPDEDGVAAFGVPPVAQSEGVLNLDAPLAPLPGCAPGLYQQPLGYQTAVASY